MTAKEIIETVTREGAVRLDNKNYRIEVVEGKSMVVVETEDGWREFSPTFGDWEEIDKIFFN